MALAALAALRFRERDRTHSDQCAGRVGMGLHLAFLRRLEVAGASCGATVSLFPPQWRPDARSIV